MSTQLIEPNVAAPVAEHAARGGAPEYLSPSAAKQYLSCSLQYYFNRVLRITKPTSPNLHLGKAVHAGLQAYNLAALREGDTTPERTLSAYLEAFDDTPDGEPVSYADELERDDHRACGDRVIQAYLQSEAAKFTARPVGVEVQLREEFRELDLPLLGVIDLVHAGYIPVDYKTVAATPNLDNETWQHQLQLIAYQVLIEAATGERVPHLELVFLVKTKTPKVIRHVVPAAGPAQKQRFWKVLQAAVQGIQDERYYPQPGMHCSWCQFRHECAQWKGGAQ